MRTEKELWQLVLSRQDLFEKSLCIWLACMVGNIIINYKEFMFLKKKLVENRPRNSRGAYFWTEDELQPRIDWINERIKQIENETI
jgi:hypothetical protein